MVLTDLNHRFVRVNAAFSKMFGYSVAEMLQMSMPDITGTLLDRVKPGQLEKRGGGKGAVRLRLLTTAVPSAFWPVAAIG